MFKLLLTLAVALITWLVAADNYRMIAPEKLPRPAQELLMRHFSSNEMSYAAAERSLYNRTYKVYLADGTTIEFDRHGLWTDIDGGREEIPAEVIPQEIRSVIKQRFPNRAIEQIERTKRGYTVELKEGPELEFDKRYRLTHIDD